nr:hypothetical protein CFP56_30879 [Quercus suber]
MHGVLATVGPQTATPHLEALFTATRPSSARRCRIAWDFHVGQIVRCLQTNHMPSKSLGSFRALLDRDHSYRHRHRRDHGGTQKLQTFMALECHSEIHQCRTVDDRPSRVRMHQDACFSIEIGRRQHGSRRMASEGTRLRRCMHFLETHQAYIGKLRRSCLSHDDLWSWSWCLLLLGQSVLSALPL